MGLNRLCKAACSPEPEEWRLASGQKAKRQHDFQQLDWPVLELVMLGDKAGPLKHIKKLGKDLEKRASADLKDLKEQLLAKCSAVSGEEKKEQLPLLEHLAYPA